MRLRKKAWAKPLLEENTFYVKNASLKGKWSYCFENNNPIYLEIGMGKGDFITAIASKNLSINYIGFEKQETVAAIALKKIIKTQLPNIRIIVGDANNLLEYFDEGEISKIFLNFSDPWPKKKHEKNRLTCSKFLSIYDYILAKDGVIAMKTDKLQFFDYSIDSFKENGWKIEFLDYNYALNDNEEDVPSEYEMRFRNEGVSINKLIARKGE